MKTQFQKLLIGLILLLLQSSVNGQACAENLYTAATLCSTCTSTTTNICNTCNSGYYYFATENICVTLSTVTALPLSPLAQSSSRVSSKYYSSTTKLFN